MAEHVYPLYDDVVFRDRISLERCRSICDGRFAPDTAFLYEPAPRTAWASIAGRAAYFDVWPDRAPFDPARPYICIGGSSSFDAADGDQVIREYARLVECLRKEYDGQLVLTASDDVDASIFRPLSRSHDLPLVGVATPVQQAVDVLGNADAYVGGRFHVAVFALRGGTPVVPLSAKTFKMEAIANLADLPSTPFPATAVGGHSDQIAQAVLDMLGRGADLRSRLFSWAETMARESWENVGYLLRRQPSAD